jgi:type II secretory pathway pseudopilin PulG
MTNRNQKIIIGVVVVAVLGLFVIGFLVGAAVVGWRAAQRAGNEAATVQNLKTIAAVETQYYNTHNRTFGTLDQLIAEKMLTSKFSGNPPAADSYVFKLNITPKTSSQPSSYTLNADPQREDTGGKHFYIDSNGSMIHFNPDGPASANDPPFGE